MRPRTGPIVVAALVLVLVLIGCSRSSPATDVKPDLSRTPPAADYSFLAKRPYALTAPTQGFEIDLRHQDLSGEDLSGKAGLLRDYATFDTRTKWPASLPTGFDPRAIMEQGRDPGLGIRELHKQGITGKGVRVAFLDQTLLVDHSEYSHSIERYREIGKVPTDAQMHGPAVLALLSGKSIGTAPGVSVTYYAVHHLDDGKVTWINHAKAIHAILDENAKLPREQQIRVIGVSLGYSPDWGGYTEIKEAVARAKQAGVLVLTSSVEEDYPFKFHGLNRDPLADPNDPSAYRPGSWLASRFYANPGAMTDRILAPMDSRTSAAPNGTSDYAFFRQGGWSWVIPYLEGVYALGLQVKPDLTPEEFYKAALETGSYTTFTQGGTSYRLGPIINPKALIAKLKG